MVKRGGGGRQAGDWQGHCQLRRLARDVWAPLSIISRSPVSIFFLLLFPLVSTSHRTQCPSYSCTCSCPLVQASHASMLELELLQPSPSPPSLWHSEETKRATGNPLTVAKWLDFQWKDLRNAHHQHISGMFVAAHILTLHKCILLYALSALHWRTYILKAESAFWPTKDWRKKCVNRDKKFTTLYCIVFQWCRYNVVCWYIVSVTLCWLCIVLYCIVLYCIVLYC